MTASPPAELVVELLGAGSYRVSGGAQPHVVTVTDRGVSCNCPDFHYRRELAGEQCKHLRAVAAYLLGAPLEPTIAVAAGPGLVDVDVPPTGCTE